MARSEIPTQSKWLQDDYIKFIWNKILAEIPKVVIAMAICRGVANPGRLESPKGCLVSELTDYGPEGWAETDYDFGHNHPPGCPGDPHAYDFKKS